MQAGVQTRCRVPALWNERLNRLSVSSRISSSHLRKSLQPSRRQYAQPSNIGIPSAKVAFKPPPPPPQTPVEPTTVEHGHGPGEAQDAAGPFDSFLARTAESLKAPDATSVTQLYSQYRERGGRTCPYVVPYEERPRAERRADVIAKESNFAGDGLVMVVHALFKPGGKLDKVCACSGFVVHAQPLEHGERHGEIIVTCAHTLEEMYRVIKRGDSNEDRVSLSFVIASNGTARPIHKVLSSMPRCDVIAAQLKPVDENGTPRLRTLPLSPFPVYSGMPLLTHLFGATDAPRVVRSQSRLHPSAKDHPYKENAEQPIKWLNDQAWRRWGVGNMLGYRSYTNIEVEAGIHSSLPHILTSILPTPGSSGGPIVNADTGAVAGMISGRRMDNRIEGERGWGASSESIFEVHVLFTWVQTNWKWGVIMAFEPRLHNLYGYIDTNVKDYITRETPDPIARY